MTAIKTIHQKLGLNTSNGLFIFDGDKQPFVKRINKLFDINELQPHSVFCLGQKPFILFYENPTNKEAIFKAVWNLNEVPIIIISEANTINIYNGFEYLKNKASLASIGSEDHLADFEYFKLVTGKTWEKYEKELSYKSRVDYKLLENIKDARSILMNDCGLDNHAANSLLGKCIFTRYLIDRHVRIGFDSEPREWTTEDFCQVLTRKESTLNFFKYLQEQFNGDLFPFDGSNINKNSLNIIIDLLQGTGVKTGQISLFDVFDFSIIPVEFISNVYELFIGQEEQAKRGAYYTPLFLVEYIISQTVQKHFSDNNKNYNCKILDPACGSGIFLVEALRVIIERFNSLHTKLSRGSKEYRDRLRKLAEDNIFGIDKDKSAISVAMFSVYLTLLDYQSPRDIENFKFPRLLNKNFFKADFFDLNHSFNESCKKIQFDFIIGNPPWKRGIGKEKQLQLFEKYINQRKEEEKEQAKQEVRISISNKEIAQAFLLRTSDFSSSETRVSFIVTSKTLYNLNAQDFRKYFFRKYFIDRVFELSPVRKEVFDKSNDPSVAPAAVIFYRYAFNSNTGINETEHYSVKSNRFFSLFKLFLIQRNDVKKTKQSLFMNFDWLWKALLYGNFHDFYLIKRLKDSYKTISKVANEKNCLVGQGVMINGNRELKDATHLLGKQYIRTTDDIEPFLLKIDPKLTWNIRKALYPRDPNLYKAPLLLITGGISKEFKATSAIGYEQDIVFKSSLTAIRCDDVNFLENVCGLLHSTLFAYYLLITGSSAGVEREEAHDEEKLSFPYEENKYVASIVNDLHKIKEELLIERDNIFNIDGTKEQALNRLEKALNKTVFETFRINHIEESLIDYGVNYIIPSIMKSGTYAQLSKPLKYGDVFLKGYIDVFYSKFADVFDDKDKSFQVEVWHSEQIIGIFFNVISSNKKPGSNIQWREKENNDLIKKLIVLGHEKITDKLFIQKDIRGFERNSFYIFKPNEKRVWHRALAYLDLNDFVDAILKTGKRA